MRIQEWVVTGSNKDATRPQARLAELLVDSSVLCEIHVRTRTGPDSLWPSPRMLLLMTGKRAPHEAGVGRGAGARRVTASLRMT